MTQRTHELKTWPEYFDQVWRGAKTFEVRRDDRGFAEGDNLLLRRYDPDTQTYSATELLVGVTSILPGGQFGIEPGYVVMSIRVKIKIGKPVAAEQER